MTDPTPPPTDDSGLSHSEVDEIVSAVLDGEATAAEVERVHNDPALRARLAEFEMLSRQVGEPVSDLDELTSRRLIATALEAAGSPPWWRKNLLGIGSAAAVIVLALLVVPVLGNFTDENADTASVATDNTFESLDTMSEGHGSEDGEANANDGAAEPDFDLGDDASGGEADEGMAPESVDPLYELARDHETYADVASFERAVLGAYAEQRADADDPSPPTAGYNAADDYSPIDELEARCGSQPLDEQLTGDRRLVGQAQGLVDGQSLIALVIAGPQGSADDAAVLIIDPDTCAVIN